MYENKCEGCIYDLSNKNAINKETFNNILDNCCNCKRAILKEYQDEFPDLYKKN